MNNGPQDLFYDQSLSRSPPVSQRPQVSQQQAQQQQTIHRQSSRNFDVYAQMPSSAFSEDQQARFEANRFDRMNAAFQNPAGPAYNFDMTGSQSWNPNAFAGANTFNSFGTIGARMKPPAPRGRHLPSAWIDTAAPPMPNLNGFGGMMPPPMMENQQMRQNPYMQESEDELIPTAIVIKNIPFAVKKEQLVELMNEMHLPLPYAFNYHFDNGVFRGLAFANFTTPEETSQVITHLNHYELQGRKLRVEYKKMLPLQERERIEREKRERRGQLEEQHRPMVTQSLQNQHSMSSMGSHVPATSPSPVSARNKPEVDLNNIEHLGFYNQLFSFKTDQGREALIFPSTLTPSQRRVVHTLAHDMGLSHTSRGTGQQRQVHVAKHMNGSSISPPIPQGSTFHIDPSRRILNRAATTDFNESRGNEANLYGSLRPQGSGYYLGIPDSPGGFGSRSELRAARSHADLRSYTPSPVPSSASFPAALQSNVARLQESAQGTGATATPTLTSAASASALGGPDTDAAIINGFGNMTIGSSIAPNGGSPRRLRGAFSWDTNQAPHTAPIGSNRNFSGINTFGDPSRERGQAVPIRQPAGPDRGAGFSRSRQNGHQPRSSDDMRHSQPEIIVE